MGSTRKQRPEGFKDFKDYFFYYPKIRRISEEETTFIDYYLMLKNRLDSLEDQRARCKIREIVTDPFEYKHYNKKIALCKDKILLIIDEYPEYFI